MGNGYDSTSYPIPIGRVRVECDVKRSRFIATLARAGSVEEARTILAEIRDEFPDASHHVYAYQVGYGASVIEGMSDDGEPSGTSGPPTLAVLRGAPFGDAVIVTTRYFGGTKLGTGGLVSAYTQAAQLAVADVKTELKVERLTFVLELPYSLFDSVTLLLDRHECLQQDVQYDTQVTMTYAIPESQTVAFQEALDDLSNGSVFPRPVP